MHRGDCRAGRHVAGDVGAPAGGEVPTVDFSVEQLAGVGWALPELLVHAGLCPSKGQARKDIDGGGIYLNNQRVVSSDRLVSTADLLFGRYLLLRKGKKTYVVLQSA